MSHTMPPAATLRELRAQFPKVRKLIETEGEVLVTYKGEPHYRLVTYTLATPPRAPVKGYMDQLRARQLRAMQTPVTTTLRDLRNKFPEVRKLVEQAGEVLITFKGDPHYRLIPYTAGKL